MKCQTWTRHPNTLHWRSLYSVGTGYTAITRLGNKTYTVESMADDLTANASDKEKKEIAEKFKKSSKGLVDLSAQNWEHLYLLHKNKE